MSSNTYVLWVMGFGLIIYFWKCPSR